MKMKRLGIALVLLTSLMAPSFLRAAQTCEGQITAGVCAYISEIQNRRLLVIDEQKGLAVGSSNLYHDSKLKNMKLKGVPGVEGVPAFQGTFNMPAIHFSKSEKARFTTLKQLVSCCPTEPRPDGNRTTLNDPAKRKRL